ncbi:carbohydrate ABC transporter permease [Phyllobacterium bourgognense]|uniref:Multiple sugar transport system permease protein n=1 Tax=Phyllobacterium bourgognense TaxID=314236 RepID=A0A368YSD7_9HYPH|nr:carbohydrate ABC transporter permease [Phyllobacterium bourgognense]RCW81837.1 multiple sugar transport system permease protein [Phyllobacterium bourgognense]
MSAAYSAPLRSTLFRHGLLVIAAALVLFPFLWIVAAAFKTQISLLTGQLLFQPTLANFVNVLFSSTSDYVRNFSNSLVIASASTVLVLVVATLAAYSLQCMQWPSWVLHSMLGWSVIFHMVPPITLAGAWYSMFRTIGLDNTYTGLILAHTTLNLPMALWMMGVFVRDVPKELIEAAKIDGAGTPRILRHVIVPLVRPGLAAAGILSFIFSWNEFAVVLTLSQRQTATVPVAIGKYAQENTIAYTEMAAASVLSMMPAVLLLLIAQRFIVRGLTTGAVK